MLRCELCESVFHAGTLVFFCTRLLASTLTTRLRLAAGWARAWLKGACLRGAPRRACMDDMVLRRESKLVPCVAPCPCPGVDGVGLSWLFNCRLLQPSVMETTRKIDMIKYTHAVAIFGEAYACPWPLAAAADAAPSLLPPAVPATLATVSGSSISASCCPATRPACSSVPTKPGSTTRLGYCMTRRYDSGSSPPAPLASQK